MQATRAVELGKVYQLNNAKARVVGLSYDEVIWIAPRKRGRLDRHFVPRWFFEKHATILSNGDRNNG